MKDFPAYKKDACCCNQINDTCDGDGCHKQEDFCAVWFGKKEIPFFFQFLQKRIFGVCVNISLVGSCKSIRSDLESKILTP